MNHLSPHLTEDQIDDLLLGDAPAAIYAHLDACPRCAAQFAAANEPMAAFNAVSLAWGERRSATLPLQLRQQPAGLFPGGRLRVAIGAAAAAVFIFALALPIMQNEWAKQTAHTANAAPQQAPQTALASATASAPELEQSKVLDSETPAQQIARDNRLLQAIDRELATSETPADLLKMAGRQDANQSSPDRTHND